MNDERLPARALYCHIQGERDRGQIPEETDGQYQRRHQGFMTEVDLERQNDMETLCDRTLHQPVTDGREK